MDESTKIEFTLPAGMTLRAVTGDDHELLAAWVKADPEHAGATTPEFFSQNVPGAECFVLTDAEGVVFFLKLTRTIRIDIQFAPDCRSDGEQGVAMRERTRVGLVDGFAWLNRRLAGLAFHEVLFNSRNPRLIAAMRRRLGFQPSPHELVRALDGINHGKAN